MHDAALDETEELDGTDGDLLIVGALGMGITDEERMGHYRQRRARGRRGGTDRERGRAGLSEELPKGLLAAGAAAAAAPARKLSPHELWTLGADAALAGERGSEGSGAGKCRRGSRAVKQSKNRETLLKQPVKHQCIRP